MKHFIEILYYILNMLHFVYNTLQFIRNHRCSLTTVRCLLPLQTSNDTEEHSEENYLSYSLCQLSGQNTKGKVRGDGTAKYKMVSIYHHTRSFACRKVFTRYG
jgi:hypothetical protein